MPLGNFLGARGTAFVDFVDFELVEAFAEEFPAGLAAGSTSDGFFDRSVNFFFQLRNIAIV